MRRYSHRDKLPDLGMKPVLEASPKQIRRTHAEIASKNNTLPKLDLHGVHPPDAPSAIRQFITGIYATNADACEIIHGIGEGKMQKIVQKEVDELVRQGIVEDSFTIQGGNMVIVFCP